MTILKYPHPYLKRIAKPITTVTQELRDAANEMKAFVDNDENQCVGLAATQLGYIWKFFVIKWLEPSIFINPRITYRSKETNVDVESCMSLPGDFIKIRRHNKIKLHAYSLDGQEINMTLSGMRARVIQHEDDHLHGITLVERSSL